MTRTGRSPIWMPLLCCLAAAPGCSPDPDGDTAAEGTRGMVERLEAIAAGVDPEANPYANGVRVEHFRRRLDSLRTSAAAEEPPPEPILRARFTLANELLLDGQSAEAAREFEALLQDAEMPGNRHNIRILLGLTWLRLGEQENCVVRHTIDSCLMPVGGAGVHLIERGSRGAVREFGKVLERNPRDLSARWLLNIAYMTLGEHPGKVPPRHLIPEEAFASDYDIGQFRDVAPALGLDLVGLAGGGIMEDFDGDGHLDVFATSWGLRDQVRYFRNGGDGSFSDLTEAAGLLGIVGGLNALQTDYDNDGWADLLVLRGAWLNRPPATDGGRHPNSLLRNLDGVEFADVTAEAGLLSFHPTQTAAWGDCDNDGWLDLYIGNESLGTDRHPNELYLNSRDGSFLNMAPASGVAVEGYVKGVVWGDYDNDGRLDLYVSRLLEEEPNLLFRNRAGDSGPPRFDDVTEAAGVPGPAYSFPAWFWDYDNDGWLDLFVSGYRARASEVAADYLGIPHYGELPRLYRNNRDGSFADLTRQARLDKPLLTMGSNFGDLDNDGWLDCYAGTGSPGLTSLMPNRMFRNAGGRFFQDVTTSGGFGHIQKGHGVAFGDADHDGDQDVYATMGGAYAGDVYQNILFENPGHGNRWLKLKLVGVRSNRAGIGARIKVTVATGEGERAIYATVGSGGSFGASSFRKEIGLGQATAIRSLEVYWPASGERQLFEGVEMDRVLQITEGDPAPKTLHYEPFRLGAG